MAKETHKRIIVWLNQQGIENNLKSVRAAISKTTNEMAKLPAFYLITPTKKRHSSH